MALPMHPSSLSKGWRKGNIIGVVYFGGGRARLRPNMIYATLWELGLPPHPSGCDARKGNGAAGIFRLVGNPYRGRERSTNETRLCSAP